VIVSIVVYDSSSSRSSSSSRWWLQVSFILLAGGNERGESTAVGRGFQTFKQKSYKFDFYKGCKHKFGSSYSSLASKRIMEAK